MPAGAFVVESGMYKVNSGRSRSGAVGETGEQWERPEPVYWKQVINFSMDKNIIIEI